MFNKLELITKVKNHKLDFSKEDFKKISSNLAFCSEEEEILLTIEKYNKLKQRELKRTEQQNKYYHKLLDIICDYTGDEHLSLHTDLKCMFLTQPWVKEDREYLIVKSTRDLKPSEFGVYLEKIFKWASEELNLILPNSEDYY